MSKTVAYRRYGYIAFTPYPIRVAQACESTTSPLIAIVEVRCLSPASSRA